MFKVNDLIKVYVNDVYFTRATVTLISGDILYCVDNNGPFLINQKDDAIKVEVLHEEKE